MRLRLIQTRAPFVYSLRFPEYFLPRRGSVEDNMAGAKVFSIEGKGLKLTTAEDIEPHIQDLKSNDSVEEIKFLGNTLGIGASEALAKVLESKKSLQVRILHHLNPSP